MSRILHGDPTLVAVLRDDDQLKRAERLMTAAARCWDTYGLPDGRRNPTSGSPTGVHFSITPTEIEINEALNAVISPHLPADQRWLLDIPRVLVPGTATARMIVSSSGGVALGLPWALFGGLFLCNEVLITLQIEKVAVSEPGAPPPDARRRRTHELLHARIGDGLPTLLRHFLTGEPLPSHLDVEAELLEMALDVWVHDKGQIIGSYVRSVTLIQQVLILLHELGHVSHAAEHDLHQGTVKHDLADLEEVLADAWGANLLQVVCETVIGRDELVLLQAVTVLYEMLDTQGGHGNGLAQRCANLVRILNPQDPPFGVDDVMARWQALRDLIARPGLLSACYENMASFLDMIDQDNIAEQIRRLFPEHDVADRLDEHLRIQRGRKL